jgi:hypothetical protein
MRTKALYSEVLRMKGEGAKALDIAKALGVPLSLVSHLSTLEARLSKRARDEFRSGRLSISGALCVAKAAMMDQDQVLDTLRKRRKRTIHEVREYYHRLAYREEKEVRWWYVRETLAWVLGISDKEPI